MPGAELHREKLKAPRGHGARLILPELKDLPALAAANRARLLAEEATGPWQPRWEAPQARADLVRAAVEYTGQYRDVPESRTDAIVLAGHQPRLDHPGVWLKNAVLSEAGRRCRAAAIHLIIDNDLCRQRAIQVPSGTLKEPTREWTPFDAAADVLPFEERHVADLRCLRSFPARVRQTLLEPTRGRLLLEQWPTAWNAQEPLGWQLARWRSRLEGDWGFHTLEVPLSRVCDQPAFWRFAAAIVRDARRLHVLYNTALAEYRERHRLRSRSHPAPDLQRDGSSWEVPLWTWSSSEPTRQRLFVHRTQGQLQLTDRGGFVAGIGSEDAPLDALAERLSDLRGGGRKVRPRALMTTLFARLVLGDLFIHGIGGAIYDELTETLIQRWVGTTPPSLAVATGTLHLFSERISATEADLRGIDRRLRDLIFSPEDQLPAEAAADADVQALVAEKANWVATSPPPGEGKPRRQAIRRINQRLQPAVESVRRELLRDRERIERELSRRSVLHSREWSFCLFSADVVRPWLETSTDRHDEL